MRVNRIKLVFLDRPIPQSELHRHIIEPAWCEAAIEMPQVRNDNADNRNLDIGSRLIEDKEIEAGIFRQRDASCNLLMRVELAELNAEIRLHLRIFARNQIGILLQA